MGARIEEGHRQGCGYRDVSRPPIICIGGWFMMLIRLFGYNQHRPGGAGDYWPPIICIGGWFMKWVGGRLSGSPDATRTARVVLVTTDRRAFVSAAGL